MGPVPYSVASLAPGILDVAQYSRCSEARVSVPYKTESLEL